MATLGFDTGPLSHFAKAGWLGPLRAIVADHRVIIPDVVDAELRRGVEGRPWLSPVLDADWIEVHTIESADELEAFATFSQLLVSRGRNHGEAGVLAVALTNDGVAVIDDRAARHAADTHGVPKRPTLALICQAIRSELLTVAMASELADDLIRSDYHLPPPIGGFESWARDQGLI